MQHKGIPFVANGFEVRPQNRAFFSRGGCVNRLSLSTGAWHKRLYVINLKAARRSRLDKAKRSFR